MLRKREHARAEYNAVWRVLGEQGTQQSRGKSAGPKLFSGRRSRVCLSSCGNPDSQSTRIPFHKAWPTWRWKHPVGSRCLF